MRTVLILLRDNLRISFQMLMSHKMRSMLSILGIIFGILTLLVTLAIGEGTRLKILKTIEGMGANLVYVSVKPSVNQGTEVFQHAFLPEEIERLQLLKGADAFSPILSSAVIMKINQGEEVIGIAGVDERYAWVRDLKMREGRFLAHEDIENSSRVAVIGAQLAKMLGKDGVLEGPIQLWDSNFMIVGILEGRGRTLGVDFDRQILIPLSALQEIQGWKDECQGVWIRAEDSKLTKSIIEQCYRLFPRPDLDVWDQEALLSKKDKIMKALKWALGTIALVSLLIGGIGIMNVLLVAVAERIKEIGVRRAVGATAFDILLQFIFESILLTFLGAFLGVILGIFISDSVAWVLNTWAPTPEGWEAVITGTSVLVAFHFTFWIGIVFGLYPAWKASKLDPSEALSYY